MSLMQLVYTSEIVPAAFRLENSLESQLERMLLTARRRNQDIGLTGLLIYSGGHFLQIIEGAPRPLDRLFGRITADRRHRNVQRLSLIPIENRMFSKWSMALLNLDDRRLMDQRIVQNFLAQVHPGVTEAELAEPLVTLIAEFKSQLDAETRPNTYAYRRSYAR